MKPKSKFSFDKFIIIAAFVSLFASMFVSDFFKSRCEYALTSSIYEVMKAYGDGNVTELVEMCTGAIVEQVVTPSTFNSTYFRCKITLENQKAVSITVNAFGIDEGNAILGIDPLACATMSLNGNNELDTDEKIYIYFGSGGSCPIITERTENTI